MLSTQNIPEGIQGFLNSPLRSRWIAFGIGEVELRAYLRKARRLLGGEMRHTLDVANVEADVRGRGAFKLFITEAELIAQQQQLTVFVENVHNERLAAHLLRRGYVRQCEAAWNLSYFRGRI